MLKCRDVAARASDYLDRNLSSRERWQVRTHLLICHHCRKFVGQLRTVTALLQGRPQRDAEVDEATLQRCEHAVRSRLRSRGDQPPS